MTLWNGTGAGPHSMVEEYTVGDDPALDLALLPYDVEASKAHAAVLESTGILSAEERVALVGALDAVLDSWKGGSFVIGREQEDCHTAIEEALVLALGSLGKKIHTGRSRNDQVATAIALYEKEQLAMMAAALRELASALLSFAERHGKTPMPGYTHMRQAMVSTLGLWAASYAELLLRDGRLVASTNALLDACPLGTAAGYGPSITLDRALSAKLLGFAAPVVTAPAAQGFRGKNEATALFACQQAMATLGKMAADLLLYTTEEFGYLRLPAELCTGSSIMPQKRNPDVLELLRAKGAVVSAKLHEAIAIGDGLPSGYNRDYQLLKRPLFDGFALTLSSIRMMTLIVERVEVDETRILAAFSPGIVAADTATALAAAGTPFREAYQRVKGELETMGPLTAERLRANIDGKRTLGAPGNPGIASLRLFLGRD